MHETRLIIWRVFLLKTNEAAACRYRGNHGRDGKRFLGVEKRWHYIYISVWDFHAFIVQEKMREKKHFSCQDFSHICDYFSLVRSSLNHKLWMSSSTRGWEARSVPTPRLPQMQINLKVERQLQLLHLTFRTESTRVKLLQHIRADSLKLLEKQASQRHRIMAWCKEGPLRDFSTISRQFQEKKWRRSIFSMQDGLKSWL